MHPRDLHPPGQNKVTKARGKGRIEKGGLGGLASVSPRWHFCLHLSGSEFTSWKKKYPALCNRFGLGYRLALIHLTFGLRLLKIATALPSYGDPSSASRPLFIEVGAHSASPTQKAQIGPVAFFAGERARVPSLLLHPSKLI